MKTWKSGIIFGIFWGLVGIIIYFINQFGKTTLYKIIFVPVTIVNWIFRNCVPVGRFTPTLVCSDSISISFWIAIILIISLPILIGASIGGGVGFLIDKYKSKTG